MHKELLDAIGSVEGDELEWKVVDGAIVGIPIMAIPKDQAWYFSPKWQEAEKEVEEELANGGIEKAKAFKTAEDLLAHLKKS